MYMCTIKNGNVWHVSICDKCTTNFVLYKTCQVVTCALLICTSSTMTGVQFWHRYSRIYTVDYVWKCDTCIIFLHIMAPAETDTSVFNFFTVSNLSTWTHVQMRFLKALTRVKMTPVLSSSVWCDTRHYKHSSYEIYTVWEVSIWKPVKWNIVRMTTY